VYYITAGAGINEGTVISRNRDNASDVWSLTNESWFEVQTNYDHWKPIPWFDDRVTPSVNSMNAMGQKKLSLEGLHAVLSVKPVLNIQTVYTIALSPADGLYTSYIRNCEYPCTE